MPQPLSIQRIMLNQIDTEDDTFCLLPLIDRPVAEGLAESIRRVGILHPPIVRPRGEARYQLVAGRQRLQAVREHAATANCLVVAADAPDLEVLALAAEEAAAGSGLSLAEQAGCIFKALQWGDEGEVAARFLPIMGYEPASYRVRRLAALAELGEPLLLALHAGDLDHRAAVDLAALPFSDRMALFDIIDMLGLSVSNQRRLIAGCQELAARNDTSIINLLADPALREILVAGDANRPQRTARLMAWLQRQRSPRLSEAEDEFRRFVVGMKLPKDIRVEHAPSFEDDTLQLTIPFADREALQRCWPALAAVLDR